MRELKNKGRTYQPLAGSKLLWGLLHPDRAGSGAERNDHVLFLFPHSIGGHSSRECPCVQNDDLNQIYPAVRECDVIVQATPLYYWNMSGQIRTAVARLFGLEEGDENLLRGHGRASALLMAAEGNGFEDVVSYYDHLMEHLKWKNLGHVLAGGNGDVGDIKGKLELEHAYELGRSI
ncbi:MAG: NAD(P)H-dependent oxidoreductase [Lachnospiraceae bacterium]|nr:NAD(P)H-dependent oxidoreductase [Lachnospiraceae bacterium]